VLHDVDPNVLLLGYGPLGVFVVWLMWRVEERLDRIDRTNARASRALDAHTRSILLEVVSRPTVPVTIEREARRILGQLEAEATGDNGGG